MFVNFHTHCLSFKKNEISIFSFDVDERYSEDLKFVSIGLHPWKLENNWKLKLKELEILLKERNPLALGEFGLDRVRGPSLDLQEEVFHYLIDISEKYQKPCIIHSVRTHEKIIYWHKKLKPSMFWIIHGFIGSFNIANSLWNRNIYTSFGKSICINDRNKEIFRKAPLNKIFLETDDSNYDIMNIYNSASILKGISIEEVIDQVNKNIKDVFGINI